MRRTVAVLCAARMPPAEQHATRWVKAKRPFELKTAVERIDHRRDREYGQYRSLPDVPWTALKEKTFLDEAERKYGRKETWHAHPDPQVRLQLVRVLKAFLDKSLTKANEKYKLAKHYETRLEQSRALFRSRVHAALTNPQTLRTWAQSECKTDREELDDVSGEAAGDVRSSSEGLLPTRDAYDSAGESTQEREEAEARRRRGASAVLEGTVAMADEPFRAPYSEFPFLRQRVLNDGGNSLDPSLVDWTSKFFPADNAKTFTAPPVPRAAHEELTAVSDGSDAPMPRSKVAQKSSRGGMDDRSSLAVPLEKVTGAHKIVADQSGVYYKVRAFTEQDEKLHGDRALRPPKKAKDGYGGPVRKVDWETVERAKQSIKTPDVHRAKERLFRITRGEDPDGIQ